MRYVPLHNHQLPQWALKNETPMKVMKDWYASHPNFFVKRPYDHPGCDTLTFLPENSAMSINKLDAPQIAPENCCAMKY